MVALKVGIFSFVSIIGPEKTSVLETVTRKKHLSDLLKTMLSSSHNFCCLISGRKNS